MTTEHPIEQPILAVSVIDREDEQEYHRVGMHGVTRIEATTKSGMHADIPYVRVWRGDECAAEYCQHNIIGVYFETADTYVS